MFIRVMGAAIAVALLSIDASAQGPSETPVTGSVGAPANASPGTTPPPPVLQRLRGELDQYDAGRVRAREPTIKRLREAPRGEAGDFAAAHALAMSLSGQYLQRSGRMQTNLDLSSASVTLGGAGYFLSSAAGAVTQSYWAYGALLPVLSAQFNAHEPTRDLFFGAALGVDQISNRYSGLQDAQAVGVRLRGASNRAAIDLAQRCGELNKKILIARGWPANGLDLNIILPDLLRISEACASAKAAEDNLAARHVLVADWNKILPRLYRRDLLALDANLAQRDNQLRYTPAGTLSAIAAAPFQAASKLLTGEDGKGAIDELRKQQALANLDITLSHVPAPPPFTPVLPPASLSAASLAREDTSVRRTSTTPSAATVEEVLSAAKSTLVALRLAEQQFALESQAAAAASSLARADRLSFRYDAATRGVTVALAAPPPAT